MTCVPSWDMAKHGRITMLLLQAGSITNVTGMRTALWYFVLRLVKSQNHESKNVHYCSKKILTFLWEWYAIIFCCSGAMYSALVSLAARSRWTDESFKMCHFRDDPAPLNGTIRSAQLKYLLRENCSIFLNLYITDGNFVVNTYKFDFHFWYVVMKRNFLLCTKANNVKHPKWKVINVPRYLGS